MILIYTGNGKGKTSASVGQTVRAVGQGMKVAFGQFMKRNGQAGEQVVLTTLLGDLFFNSGAGFFRKESERETHRQAAEPLIAWALNQLDVVDMLVLDEALYALGSGLITKDELESIVLKAQEKDVHLVLSGRGVPDWLAEQAHLITEMGEVKHPFNSGHKATKGIEF